MAENNQSSALVEKENNQEAELLGGKQAISISKKKRRLTIEVHHLSILQWRLNSNGASSGLQQQLSSGASAYS